MIKTFWHRCDNFGDKLTPYVLNKLGLEFEYVDQGHNEEHYIFCGSILSACNENSIIWGAGNAQYHETIRPKEILACRGSKTRQMLIEQGIDCPEIYGDFGMILPMIYKPNVLKKRKVGIIPHVVDQRLFNYNWNLNRPVEKTIDYILESEMIISSSLHALIVAHAYGVPYQWIRSTNVIGDDFKFYDFFETDYDLSKFIEVCPFKDILIKHDNDTR